MRCDCQSVACGRRAYDVADADGREPSGRFPDTTCGRGIGAAEQRVKRERQGMTS